MRSNSFTVSSQSSVCPGPFQRSVDPTECAHIDTIKNPFDNTNCQYGPQICPYLDRDKKRRLFDLVTAIHEAEGDLESLIYNSASDQVDGDNEGLDDEPSVGWVAEPNTTGMACSPSRKTVDLFASADSWSRKPRSKVLRTYHCHCAPLQPLGPPSTSTGTRISVDSLAHKYNFPDLRPALLDFFAGRLQTPSIHHICGRQRTRVNTHLPFSIVLVWHSLCVQTRELDSRSVTDLRCLNVVPPRDSQPLGRYDTVLSAHNSANPTPFPGVGLDGESLGRAHPVKF